MQRAEGIGDGREVADEDEHPKRVVAGREAFGVADPEDAVPFHHFLRRKTEAPKRRPRGVRRVLRGRENAHLEVGRPMAPRVGPRSPDSNNYEKFLVAASLA